MLVYKQILVFDQHHTMLNTICKLYQYANSNSDIVHIHSLDMIDLRYSNT